MPNGCNLYRLHHLTFEVLEHSMNRNAVTDGNVDSSFVPTVALRITNHADTCLHQITHSVIVEENQDKLKT